MIATIKGLSVEIPVTTISVAPADDDTMLAFHCTNCSETICQYQGYVTKIYPYLEPSPEALVLKWCRKCRQQYRFLTHRGYITKTVKVILFHNKMGISDFYCYEDRSKVVSYDSTRIFSTRTHDAVTLPVTLKCPALTCPIEYYFAELL